MSELKILEDLKVHGDLKPTGAIHDSGDSPGTIGQILQSTATGTDWVDGIDISAGDAEAIHLAVKNTSGATITKGTPVYITGNVGNSDRLEVAPADASDASKMPAVGLLESDLANNAQGYVAQGGYLKGLATATIDGTSTSSNDTVYVKAGGGLTMTKPTGTNYIQNVAKVARVHASNGSLVVSSILRTNDVPTPLYIDHTNQRLGIGETSPGRRLHVKYSAQGVARFESTSSTNGFIDIKDANTTADNKVRFGAEADDLLLFAGGAERLRIDSSGYVGIGTTNPSVKLDVKDTLNSARPVKIGTTGNSYTAIDIYTNSIAAGNLYLIGYGSGNPQDGAFAIKNNSSHTTTNSTAGDIWFATGGSSTERLRIKGSSGNVGIGTNSPDAKLHINGGTGGDTAKVIVGGNDAIIKLGDNQGGGPHGLQFDGVSGVDGMSMYYRTTPQHIVFEDSTGTSGNSIMVIERGGNVGIGTTSPSYKLDVDGTARLQVATSADLTFEQGANQYQASINSSNHLVLQSAANNQVIFRSGGTTNMIVDGTSNNVGIGTTSPSSTLHVADTGNAEILIQRASGAGVLIQSQASVGVVGTNTNNRLDLKTNGGTRATISTDGNVGIGTTSPDTILHIESTSATGAILNLETTHSGGIPIYNMKGAHSAQLRYQDENGNNQTRIDFLDAGAMSFIDAANGNTRIAIKSSGNVGIGTGSPGQKLHVDGNIRVGDSADAIYSNKFYGLSNTSVYLQSNSGYPIIFNAGASEKMRITSSGNVGIGTTSPAVELEVDGHIMSDTHFRSSDTNATLSAQDGGNVFLRPNGYSNTSGQVVVKSTGNVGIGTDSPGATLQVGDGTVDENIRAYYNDNTFTELRGYGIQTNRGTAYFRPTVDNTQSLRIGYNYLQWQTLSFDATTTTFNVNGSEKLRINSSGDVGIGTTSPSEKLHVSGNTRLDGLVGINGPTSTDYQLNLQFDNTNPDDDFHFAQRIDGNFSGADNTTGDREQGGIYIDIDSSADGDSSNEHRLYGIFNDVRFTGFSDVVYAAFNRAESNNNTESTSVLAAAYNYAVHDSGSAGGVSNLYGSLNYGVVDDAGDVTNVVGSMGAALISSVRTANIGTLKGVVGEVQIDSPNAITYGNVSGVEAIIDNNEGSTPTGTNTFLFKGNYQGTRYATNAYGLYVQGNKHYLEGSVGINTTSPDANLHISGISQTGSLTPFKIENDTNNLKFSVRSVLGDYNLQFKNAANTVKVLLNSNGDSYLNGGNVGIGTTSPSTKLEVNGAITLTHNTFGEGLILNRDHASNASTITFKNNSGQAGILYATYADTTLRWRDGSSSNSYEIWHEGNDGSGSGLDADTVDGIQAASFLRSDASDSFSGILTGTNTGENLKVGGIRGTTKGSQTGQYIHLYERVHVGGPSGWGHSSHGAPSNGLSTWGSVDFGMNGTGVIQLDGTTIVNASRELINVTNTNWDTAYGWGNHASAGYITGISFADVSSKPAFITNSNLQSRATTAPNTAGDGTGASFHYLSSAATNKPAGTDHSLLTMAYSNDWQTQIAQDWRNKGRMYLRGQSSGTWSSWIRVHTTDDFSTTDVSNGATAYGWGNHASAGYLTDSSTQSKYLRSDADDTFTGNLTTGANNHITFGPNSTWGSSLRVGGNGHTATGTEMASVVTTDGNLHLDAAESTNATYLNYYAGTRGTIFGNGDAGIVARIDSSGNLYKASTATNITETYWHSGNDGSDSGLDADTLDGQHASSFLRSDQNDTTSGILGVNTTSLESGVSLTLGRTNGLPSIKADSSNGGYLILDSKSNFLSLNHYVNQDVVIGNGGGNVGIGTTSPSGGDYTSTAPKLHVKGADTAGSYTTVARFQAGNDSDNTGAAVLINHNNDRGLAIRAGRKDSDRAVAYFDLISSSGSATNMLTLGKYASDFRVGIGTTSPLQAFHTDGVAYFSGGTNVAFQSGGDVHASTAIVIDKGYRIKVRAGAYLRDLIHQDSSTSLIKVGQSGTSLITGINLEPGHDGSAGSAQVRVYGGSTEYVRFDGYNKRVGIGTTSPSNKLHVVGGAIHVNSSGDKQLRFSGTNKNTYSFEHDTSRIYIYDETNASARFTIMDSGNVGIGTTSPLVKLDVNGDIQSYGTSPRIVLKETGANKDYNLRVYSGGRLAFLNDNTTTETMSLLQNGNLGIGTTAPGAKLHVYDGNIRISNSNGTKDIAQYYNTMTFKGDSNCKFYFGTSENPSYSTPLPVHTGKLDVTGHIYGGAAVQTITTTSGTINLDAEDYGVFRLTSSLSGTTTLNIQNMKSGQVIDVILTGDQTVNLTSDDTSETFYRIGETTYDGTATNHLQIVCISDTDSAAIYHFTVAKIASSSSI